MQQVVCEEEGHITRTEMKLKGVFKESQSTTGVLAKGHHQAQAPLDILTIIVVLCICSKVDWVRVRVSAEA
jgi:hypothetical protein